MENTFMKLSYESINIDWLTENKSSTSIEPDENPLQWYPFTMPPEIGSGGFHKIDLPAGASIFHAVNSFLPASKGKLLSLMRVEITYPEESFVVQSVTRGRFIQHEEGPHEELILSPGIGLFRLADSVKFVPVFDCSERSEISSLNVGKSTLNNLLGATTTDELFTLLGLYAKQRALISDIPPYISAHLVEAISPNLIGSRQKLFCQSRMLDYLGALIEHIQTNRNLNPASKASKERTQAVHDFLIALEGHLPTLDEIANQFGYSARCLNNEFKTIYGQSIYAFISSHRLNMAHEAILKSNVPMKVLAHQLGYAHFNHFSAAFKKKFGYPPGSLRKR